MSEAFKAAHDAASAATQASAGSTFTLGNIVLGYNSNAGKVEFSITFTVGRRTCRDFGTIEFNEMGTEATIELTSANKASADFDATAPDYTAFKQLFNDTFAISNITPMNPDAIVFESKTNPEISFTIKLK